VSTARYKGPIRRRETGRGHRYEDANGAKVPGVTTIISQGTPKPALINWAGNATAEYAVDHWDELGELPPSARLNKLKKARYEDRDTAANRGTAVHNLAEKLVQGEEVDVPDLLTGHVENYVRFLDDWEPDPFMVETVVMSHQHGYAGTLDLGADILSERLIIAGALSPDFDRPTVRCLIDLKTSRSGIFGETALQLAGYRYADVYVDENGDEQPMPEFDIVLGLHVRADSYALLPIVAGQAQLRELLYVREVGRFAEEHARDYVGSALTPPTGMTRRRLEIVQGVAA
jgi:hypothetical protein